MKIMLLRFFGKKLNGEERKIAKPFFLTETPLACQSTIQLARTKKKHVRKELISQSIFE
jgi:hypothetical protein